MLRNKTAHHTSSRFRTNETEVLHVCQAFIHFLLHSFVRRHSKTYWQARVDFKQGIIYLSLMLWFAMIFFFFFFFLVFFFQFNFFVFIDKTFDLFPSLFMMKEMKKNLRKTINSNRKNRKKQTGNYRIIRKLFIKCSQNRNFAFFLPSQR